MTTSEEDQSCWGSTHIILTIIFGIVAFVLMVSLIPLLVTFCTNVKKETESVGISPKLKKILDYSGYCIWILVVFSITIQTVYVIDYCMTGHDVLDILTNFNCTINAIAMLSLWFIRLTVVFMGTQFAVSKCVTYIYISIFAVLFLLATILSFVGPLFSSDENDIISIEHWWMGMMALGGGYICTLIALSVLFVKKLILVYKNVVKDKKMIHLITKVTILNFGSISMTFVMVATMTLYGVYVYARFINSAALVMDYYTNLWCVMLSYHYFEEEYKKRCQCFHAQCSRCWFKCVRGNETNVSFDLGSTSNKEANTPNPSDISLDDLDKTAGTQEDNI